MHLGRILSLSNENFRNEFDEFLKITNLNQSNLVIYNNYGELIVAKCDRVNNIEIVEQQKKF